MDESRELLAAIIRNQEAARAEIKGGLDRLETELRNTNRRIDDTNKRLDDTNKRLDRLSDDLNSFKGETAESFKLLNLRMDEINFERRSEKRLVQSLEKDLNEALFRIEKIEACINRQ